ncbi:hypothetical protein AB0L40_20380 [Patulibacter sp. NPDC049589]|uniref:hypothetical protein n=1 Tax=Patulibacter sp. NPDC049589 TaxID=3154731 RepID=UPI0034495513
MLVALVVTPVRRPTALRCGLGVLVGGLAVLAAERSARAVVTGAAEAGRDREIAGAAWDELLGGLRPDVFILAVAGLVVVVVAAAVGRLGAPGRPGHPVG